MANELNVNTDGLRVAAANSDVIAGALTGAAAETSAGSQPSGSGIAALDLAISTMQAHQSARISGRADDLSVSSARYDESDGGSAESISVTV